GISRSAAVCRPYAGDLQESSRGPQLAQITSGAFCPSMSPTATAVALDEPFLDSAVTTCRHCGDPCDRQALSTERGVFCCTGCEAVYTLIATHGLSAFYTCDVN